MDIALLGVGLMGGPMAQRLCAAGHRLHVWNRTASKAAPLAALGAQVHTHAAHAAQQAEVVLTMLSDGDAVGAVMLGEAAAAHSMRPGALWLDMSSIAPVQARAHAAQAQALGLAYVDAPVSGGTLGAEQGTLAIMAGGDATQFARAQPVFAALGRATHVGPVGTGQLAKLANQMVVGITIGAVAEALLLCEKGGADIAKVKEAISGGFADSRVLQVHGQRMVERDFAPRARMTVQLKDLRNALTTAQSLHFEPPVTQLLAQLYEAAIAHGDADLDHAGLWVELARRSGP